MKIYLRLYIPLYQERYTPTAKLYYCEMPKESEIQPEAKFQSKLGTIVINIPIHRRLQGYGS